MSSQTRQNRFLRAFMASVLGTGLSRILGAVRDIVVAGWLGAGASSDAFFIAFTVPNVFRRFVADEGLTGALIPSLSRADADPDPHASTRLANTVLSALLVANLVLCTLGVLFAEPLVMAIAWSYADDPEQLELTTSLTRWMFPFLAMVSLVSFFEGLLNQRGHFFTPKVAPGLVSAGMALCLVLGADLTSDPAFALAFGVLVGGTAHVLINVPMVWHHWGPLGLGVAFSDPRFRHIAIELGKVILIGVFAQLNIFVLRGLASTLEYGAVTCYWNANRVVDLSQGVIAVAIGSALLPDISSAVADQAWDRFRSDLVRALRLAAFLLLPAAVVIGAFGTPIVSVLFRHGAYTWANAEQTALTLQLMIPFLLAVAGMNIVKKVYFALDDRVTLLVVGALGVVLTASFGWVLLAPLGVAGLGLALSIATSSQLLVYLLLLRRRLGAHLGLAALGRPLALMTGACVPTGLVLVGAAAVGDWPLGPASATNLALVALGLLAAAVTYIAAARALGVREADIVLGRLSSRFSR
ncbi:MAG: putative peptidoglycan lipid II flippase [Myxococcota bacterium]|jgi:putative peptidoglycan lipid II flippase